MHLRRTFGIPLLLVLTGCATGSRTIPEAWLSVPEAARIGSVELGADGKVQTSPDVPPKRLADGPIALAGTRLTHGLKVLTEPYAAVDSFDYLESRGEVVFSAKRTDNFDIGLVSADGGKVNWVPEDRADERLVSWAPRGSKIAYVVRGSGGDLIRTVHVPTSFALNVDVPRGRVHALSWDPAGDRFAVVISAADASDRVEVMKYGGEERRIAVPPAVRLDVDVEPFAPGAIILRPRSLAYSEKLPVVVWLADDVNEWSDARAALLGDARVACIVTTAVSDALWKTIETTPWLDGGRAFTVGAPGKGLAVVAGDAVPAGRYTRRNNVLAVPPAVVQSFAARFIADQLKRTPPTNGSSR